jgi:hypothetical protein
MPSTTARGRRAPGRPLKSPLAVAGDYAGPRGITPEAQTAPALEGIVLSDREASLAELEDYLRTVNNRGSWPARPSWKACMGAIRRRWRARQKTSAASAESPRRSSPAR